MTLILVLPKGLLNKLKIFSLFILIIIFIFNYNNNFSDRLFNITKINIKSFVIAKNNDKKNILSLSRVHDDHYLFQMFKDNILFGQGLKMFRIKCSEEKFNVGIFSCATHPHNIIIQFLAELGIVGIIY